MAAYIIIIRFVACYASYKIESCFRYFVCLSGLLAYWNLKKLIPVWKEWTYVRRAHFRCDMLVGKKSDNWKFCQRQRYFQLIVPLNASCIHLASRLLAPHNSPARVLQRHLPLFPVQLMLSPEMASEAPGISCCPTSSFHFVVLCYCWSVQMCGWVNVSRIR